MLDIKKPSLIFICIFFSTNLNIAIINFFSVFLSFTFILYFLFVIFINLKNYMNILLNCLVEAF